MERYIGLDARGQSCTFGVIGLRLVKTLSP